MSYVYSKTRLALATAVGLVVAGAGITGVSMAQSGQQAHEAAGEAAGASEHAPYRSSIQVPNEQGEQNEQGESSAAEASEGNGGSEANEANGANEANEGAETAEAGEATAGQEANNPAEQQESAKYQALARISVDQARNAAVAQVPGTVTAAQLENEDGNLVYGVSVKTAAGEQDVKVDAGNGRVLHVEKGGEKGGE